MARNKTDAIDADGLAHLAEAAFLLKAFDSMLVRTLAAGLSPEWWPASRRSPWPASIGIRRRSRAWRFECSPGTNGRVNRDSWVPRCMGFPASTYTGRGGVGSAERAQRLAMRPAARKEPGEVEDDPVDTDAEDTPVVEAEDGMRQAA